MTETDGAIPTEKSNEILRNIIPFKTIQSLSTKSDTKGLLQLSIHLSITLSSLTLHYIFRNSHMALWLSSLFLHAWVMSFLFMPLHETVHKTAFKSLYLNRVVGCVCGVLTLRPMWNYLYYHFPHHRYTGDVERDPELANSWIDVKLERKMDYWMYLSGVPFWIDAVSTIVTHAMGTVEEMYLRTEEASRRVVMEARVIIVFYLMIMMFPGVNIFAWKYWILPSLIGQPFLRFYLIAEHTGCQLGPNMFGNTRTTITTPVYRLLAWNMPYHSEHHAFPNVPFHAIPTVHELVLEKSVAKGLCDPAGEEGYAKINRNIFRALK